MFPVGFMLYNMIGAGWLRNKLVQFFVFDIFSIILATNGFGWVGKALRFSLRIGRRIQLGTDEILVYGIDYKGG